MAQAFLTANSYLGLVVEATRGTLNTSGSPVYIPVTSPQLTPMQKFIRDEALRGSPNVVYNQIQGVRNDEYSFKSYLFADTGIHLLRSVLGTDTISGASAPYTHKINLLNAAATGSQPPSYSLLDFDGANGFVVLGSQADTYTLTFGAETAAEADVKFITNPYTSYTAGSIPTPFAATPTESGEFPIPAWDTTITVGGTASGGTVTGGTAFTYISSGELTIARKTAPIFTMGTQAPYANFAGPIEVSGKFTGVVSTTSDPWSTGTSATALTRANTPLVITLTDPNDISSSTNHSFTFQMSAVQFQNVKRTRGKEFVEVEVEFTANGNANDIGAGSGFSPMLATVVNAVSTAA
jgi:hypothetical protein